MENSNTKLILRFFLSFGIILLSINSYSADFALDIGAKRSYVNYNLRGSVGFSSDIGREYDFGLLYRMNENQTFRFNFKTATAHLDLPSGTTGETKVKDTRYELIYLHKTQNFRPYIGVGKGTNSFININTSVVTMDKLSSPYGIVGIEILGVGWAMPSVGIELINSFYARYSVAGYGKLRLEEGSLHIDFMGGYSLTTLKKNANDQRISEMNLGINIGKNF